MNSTLRRQCLVTLGSALSLTVGLLAQGCNGETGGSPSAAACDLSQKAYATLSSLYERMDKFQQDSTAPGPGIGKAIPSTLEFCEASITDIREIRSIQLKTEAQLKQLRDRITSGQLAAREQIDAKRSADTYAAAATRLQLMYEILFQACAMKPADQKADSLEAHFKLSQAVRTLHPMIEDFRNSHITALASIQCSQQAIQQMNAPGTQIQSAQVTARGSKDQAEPVRPNGAAPATPEAASAH